MKNYCYSFSSVHIEFCLLLSLKALWTPQSWSVLFEFKNNVPFESFITGIFVLPHDNVDLQTFVPLLSSVSFLITLALCVLMSWCTYFLTSLLISLYGWVFLRQTLLWLIIPSVLDFNFDVLWYECCEPIFLYVVIVWVWVIFGCFLNLT